MYSSRRGFLTGFGLAAASVALHRPVFADIDPIIIKHVRIGKGVEIEAENGIIGACKGSSFQNFENLKDLIPPLLVGKNALDVALNGAMLWEAVYPGKAQLFAQVRDPLTGDLLLNQARKARHTATGRVFVAFSTVDIALWDLRARLSKKSAFEIIGPAHRDTVPVYWRPGEVGIEPKLAAKKAVEAFAAGYHYQKYYFNKGDADGEAGFKDNVELVRVLREALPDAHLAFDNHSIRHSDNVEYSLRLCKAVAQYKPYWIEEPICPEHVDGYARIKGETGLTIAGGEHWYTHWTVKAFLDRKCVDIVQSDPCWCGGISEWLKVCELVRQYPGVKVIPHITSPFNVAPHCVASQPEDLCPILEYNSEQGSKTLEKHMQRRPDQQMEMKLPKDPGISS